MTVDVGERVSEMKRVNSREELLQKIEADIQYVRKICG